MAIGLEETRYADPDADSVVGQGACGVDDNGGSVPLASAAAAAAVFE